LIIPFPRKAINSFLVLEMYFEEIFLALKEKHSTEKLPHNLFLEIKFC